jgi:hypothetical protein
MLCFEQAFSITTYKKTSNLSLHHSRTRIIDIDVNKQQYKWKLFLISVNELFVLLIIKWD